MTIPRDLSNAISKSSTDLDKLLKQYQRDVENVVPALMAFIRSNRLDNGTLGLATISLDFVRNLLARAGIASLTEGIPELLRAMSDSALAPLAVLGEAAIPSQRAIGTILSSTYEDTLPKFAAMTEQLASTVRQEMLQMSVIPRPLSTSAQVFSDAFGITQRQAKTVVNTTLAQAQRSLQVAVLSSFEIEDSYLLYIGPDDRVTRPFCRVLEGMAIKVSDVGKLNNSQGLPVSTNGGGWNCRHSLIPVTRDFVEDQNIKVATNATVETANLAARRGRGG